MTFIKGSTSEAAQKKVKQSLPCCSVVECLTRTRRARGSLDKGAKPCRHCLNLGEEEDISRYKTRWQLRGMEIPSLVETMRQAALDVRIVYAPRALNGTAIGIAFGTG